MNKNNVYETLAGLKRHEILFIAGFCAGLSERTKIALDGPERRMLLLASMALKAASEFLTSTEFHGPVKIQ